MPIYPPDTSRVIKVARFVNVLDDSENKLSPVKINLWAANLAGMSTVAAGILAWIGGHWDMLGHVMDIGPMVGSYLGGSHASHHYDKKERNLSEARMEAAKNGGVVNK